MKHLDLFSGIGGFALAVDEVWPGAQHLFCDKEPFCRAVLKKHWPESEVYDDIRQLIADADESGLQGKDVKRTPRFPWAGQCIDLLTGGFPCQSFSHAGARRGTADDRYLWPEMYRVIQLTKPAWVIAENVRGFVTWNEGMVVEQVCSDLEAAGYEVQPLIIPAAAVGAPHRRDRIWFIAHAADERQRPQMGLERKPHEKTTQRGGTGGNAADAGSIRRESRRSQDRAQGTEVRGEGKHTSRRSGVPDWGRPWPEAATQLCSVDDGLPARVDGLKLTKAQHRDAQIKAYGNAIVPQVAEQIMTAIKEAM